jgi:hypothetical protein
MTTTIQNIKTYSKLAQDFQMFAEENLSLGDCVCENEVHEEIHTEIMQQCNELDEISKN